MMARTHFPLLLLLLGLFLSAVIADSPAADPSSSRVLVLEAANFAETISAHPYVFVEFYAPWCGHCQKLAPEYELVGERLKDLEEVRVAKVNVDAEKELAQHYSIQSLPTLVFFRNGVQKQYTGGRDAKSIEEWIRKNSKSPVTTVQTDQEQETFLAGSNEKAILLAQFPSREVEEYSVFRALSNEALFDGLEFGERIKEDSAPQVVLKVQGETFVFGDSQENLKNWILEHAFPIVGGLGESDIMRYQYKQLPLSVLFFDETKSEETASAIALYHEAIPSLLPLASFAAANGVDGMKSFQKLGYRGSLPFAVISPLNSNKAIFKSITPETTAVELKDWLLGVLEGKIKPELLTQPKPETPPQPGQVAVLVGSTVNELVLDPTKDVLLEIYAPWCGHCKSLEPIYEELAKSFADDNSVLIAKLDGTENDQDLYEISGYPTLVLFPAKDKTPIPFKGGRNLAELRAFVLEHGSKGKNVDHDEL